MDLLTRVVAGLEGFRSTVYPDPVGKPTIGYGHLLKPGESFPDPISRDEALELLRADLEESRAVVDSLFPDGALSNYESDALTSFAFNTGSLSLESSTLRQRILAGDKVAAAHEFCRWIWATEADGMRVQLPGLIRRRDIESVWFLGAHPNTVARLTGLDPAF